MLTPLSGQPLLVFPSSLCTFLPLAIFFTRNEDCRNGNVYFVIGRCVRFQSICKIMYSPLLHSLNNNKDHIKQNTTLHKHVSVNPAQPSQTLFCVWCSINNCRLLRLAPQCINPQRMRGRQIVDTAFLLPR